MARPSLSPVQKQNILQAKRQLRTLWHQSGLRQQDLLAALAGQGFEVRKNTLSNWISASDLKRPDPDCLLPLLQTLCPHQPAFARLMHGEIERLLGYQSNPESPDAVLNALASGGMQGGDPLLQRLYALEERIFIYDRSFPVLRIEADDKEQLRLALGADRKAWQPWRVSSGYEIPLSKLAAPELLARIIDSLHEGVRVLRSYVEKHLLQLGAQQEDYPLFEELLAYIWEITDRLLYNPCCRQDPLMKQPLLSIAGACQGIRYLLASRHGTPSLAVYEKVLALKGMGSQAEIQCAMAVYVGVSARRLLSVERESERGLHLCREALEMLRLSHMQLEDERARYFYKKEIANLCYDAATLLLWQPQQQALSLELMTRAQSHYAEVLESDNLFRASLNPQRLAYLQAFYAISGAWCADAPGPCLERLAASGGAGDEETLWLGHLATAIACGILHFRFGSSSGMLQRAAAALEAARRIQALSAELEREIRQDYVLARLAQMLNQQPAQA